MIGFSGARVGEGFEIKIKHLLIGWVAWTSLLIVLFAILWFWNGMHKGPEGMVRTLAVFVVISVLAPPIVWIIGKIMIG